MDKPYKCKNWEIFQKQLKKHKNQLVLDLFEVVQLVGLEDGDDDYYWIYSDNIKTWKSTCVGSFIPLNKYKFYPDLVRVWNYNGFNPNIDKAV